ncbi:hypothetical protein, partial [Bacillus anthracis]|uniref:hypothetical protein n=1 Tax=Bacillus anthracis TaxID=1392 RepID=UPI0030C708D9
VKKAVQPRGNKRASERNIHKGQMAHFVSHYSKSRIDIPGALIYCGITQCLRLKVKASFSSIGGIEQPARFLLPA